MCNQSQESSNVEIQRTESSPEAPFGEVEIILLHSAVCLVRHGVLEGGALSVHETFVVRVIYRPVGHVIQATGRHV